MVETQVINYILTNKDGYTFLENYQLTEKYFSIFTDEFKYIKLHAEKYKKCPDTLSFMQKFPDFVINEITEPESYLITELFNNHKFVLISNQLQQIATVATEDTDEAQKILENLVIDLKAIDFFKYDSVNVFSKEFKENVKKAFIKRKEAKGLHGISTGIQSLDNVFYGWQDTEELVTIIGRPNEGKSWILLYFLVKAYEAGHNVLMYSGEMSKEAVFTRIVTFMNHIGNKEIMTGNEYIEDAYFKFLELTNDRQNKFIVIEQKDIGNKNLATDTLQIYLKKHNPDIVGIDQLSLMADYRTKKNDTKKDKINHITQDLFALSTEYKVPILLAVQANRDSVNKKSKSMPPELHNIADADEIAQNSSKVLSIKNNVKIELENHKPNLYLKVIKNRFGEKDVLLGFKWLINEGYLDYKEIIQNNDIDGDDVIF